MKETEKKWTDEPRALETADGQNVPLCVGLDVVLPYEGIKYLVD
jgi:hypothetical protein